MIIHGQGHLAVMSDKTAPARRLLRSACLLLLLPTAQVDAWAAEPRSFHAPPQAAFVGYTVSTFSSTFVAAEVDTANTAKPGFKWYPYRFFGSRPKLESIVLDRDAGVTLLGDTTGPNGELASATPKDTSAKFAGTVFGGGGYFEATLKFDPEDVMRTDFKGWPSWWSMAIEHMANLETRQWPGQPNGYEHFIEADFFEYNLKEYTEKGKLNYFVGALHDWFGPSGERFKELALSSKIFIREVPADTDFTQFHKYGFLWVPATKTRDGYAEHYFDDRRVGRRIAWKLNAGEEPPPRPPWLFSIIDRNHLVLILGTGPNQPMTVRSVNVWQASDTHNLMR